MTGSPLWLPYWVLLICICFYGNLGEEYKVCKPIVYDDVLSAVEASHFVYNKKIKVGDKINGTNFEVLRKVNVSLHGQSLLAVILDSDPATIVAFRGTTNFKQLFQQFKSSLKFSRTPLVYKKNKMKVMDYFAQALDMLTKDNLIPGGVNPGRKYIITGHSLGGALASLYALKEKMKKSGLFEHPDSSLITFGSPRVGNKLFAKVHDKLIPPYRKLRFVMKQDGVASLPIIGGYKHHSTKVWINCGGHGKDTYITVCDNGDSPAGCSSKIKPKTRISHHKMEVYRNSIVDGNYKFFDKHIKPTASFEESQCIL